MTTIPQDFLDIDANEDHWIEQEYDGSFIVPATETTITEGRRHGRRLSDMTDAMMSAIPGQDDDVTPRMLHDQRFYKFCMAYLMQDGDLAVPGGRYGISTRSCAEVAIIVSLIVQNSTGEPITYHQLNSDMGLVVNSHDDVAYMLREYGQHVVGDMLSEFDLADYLDDDDICRTFEFRVTIRLPHSMVEDMTEEINDVTVRSAIYSKLLHSEGISEDAIEVETE